MILALLLLKFWQGVSAVVPLVLMKTAQVFVQRYVGLGWFPWCGPQRVRRWGRPALRLSRSLCNAVERACPNLGMNRRAAVSHHGRLPNAWRKSASTQDAGVSLLQSCI